MKGSQLARRSRDAGSRPAPKLPPFRRKALFEALEPRILLSADLNPTHEALLDPAASPLVRTVERDTPRISFAAEVAQHQSRAIIFVDPTVASFQTIVAQLPDAANAELFVLDGARDGVVQITDFLEGRKDVDAVHIVSHGSEQGAALGSATLGGSTLDAYADQLASWADALTDDADILLYGCSVGADGSLLRGLAALTGADVAASTDATGNGDWELEAAVGAIDATPFALAIDGLLDATVSGDPDFSAQGPDGTELPTLEDILASLPPTVASGGIEQGPAFVNGSPPVNAGSPVNGMASQGNPVAGAVNWVAVHPTDPKTIFVATANGGVWVTRNADATKDVDLTTITDALRAPAPAKPNLDSQGAGGALVAGKTYEYKVTFYDDTSKTESNASVTLSVTVGAGNSKVKLKDIEAGPDGTTQRRIYRKEAGTNDPFRMVHELANTGTPVQSTWEDLGAALTAANKARIEKVPFPHWEPLTDTWDSLAISALAFDVADPVLDEATLLSAFRSGQGVRTNAGASDDVRISLKDGTVVEVKLNQASRVADLQAILESASGFLGSDLTKLSVSVEAGKRLVITDNTLPFYLTPTGGSLAARDLGLEQRADAAGKFINGASRGVALSTATRLADFNSGAGVRTTGDALLHDLRFTLR
ncbi:MAG TPA: DUF4347 domain-containing protein, partial [Burkholderiales bacterium]